MKRYIIYAGVNGAGKSTLHRTPAHKDIRGFPRINTDEMVQKRGDWKDDQLQMQVGKEAVKKVKGYFANGISFNQETTLCGHSIMKNIKQAKDLGYSVEMYYVGVADAQTAIERVANRVKNGGHGIPDETIEKRYSQSMENLAKAIPLCDKVIIFDNTEQFLRFAVYEQGKMISMDEDIMPQWFKQNILQRLDTMHEQPLADIPDEKLSVLQDKEKRVLEKETKNIKATSILDRIAQKRSLKDRVDAHKEMANQRNQQHQDKQPEKPKNHNQEL